MAMLLYFLAGFFLGGLVVRSLIMRAERRHLRPHELDPEYQPAVRAVMRYLAGHGTVNLSQVEQLLSMRGITAMRYLDQMVHEGFLKLHGHRGKGAFYTRA